MNFSRTCAVKDDSNNMNCIKVYDIDRGIGTHLAIDEGLAVPGSTVVSTDSHANVLGAIGAFGQGMGDLDIAQVFTAGKCWFKVPESVKITLNGKPGPDATAKDVVLAMVKELGASGRFRDLRSSLAQHTYGC